MATYHGELEAYWEQGWEGRIEYALAIEGQPHPFFLTTGQHLTIYAGDGGVLWQGVLRLVGRGREQHSLPTDIWAFEKQRDVPYGQWLGWFLHDPPLRATVVEVPEEPAQKALPDATASLQRPWSWIGRGMRLGAAAGAGLAISYTLLLIFWLGLGLFDFSDISAVLPELGVFALAFCLFALPLGIIPATLIGALVGALIGWACLPRRSWPTTVRAALIGLAMTGAALVLVNLIVAPLLLRDETPPGRTFLYLFWLGAPGLLALVGGAWVGWRLAREMQR